MKSNDWKDRLGIMYSTNPDFQYNTGDEEEEETLPKEKQLLRIALDKRNRGGKAVTLAVSVARPKTGKSSYRVTCVLKCWKYCKKKAMSKVV